MNPLLAKEISGVWATLMVPLSADNSIDFAALSEEIDYLLASKVSGIYSNGTAGEFYNQNENEFDRISQLLAEKCEGASMPFQIGCSHMSPQISLERLERVKALKPSAVQVILPDWMPMDFREVIDFLEKMAAYASPVGLVLYNPPHAKQVLNPHQWERLLGKGIQLVGCKVAGGDSEWYKAMGGIMEKIAVFVPGHRLATGISHGAQGSYSNVACLNPVAARRWYENMVVDLQGALILEKRILRFFEEAIFPYIINQGYSNTAVDKFLAAVGGWGPISTKVRWPYKSIPKEEVTRGRKIAKKLIPEFINEL
ncbi:dihydrodipicolinate synthase family protein [Pleomorphovibrio marinus]|uniref:dihydrodipicolinate synthase family protein n=1 Tax=Pleomorphovibrio marinus TaxID=2164132 RepID=UPI000E0C8AE7|nr:dihydrodipicolinate synthase family protein [Pleomorphovibrio marinus]